VHVGPVTENAVSRDLGDGYMTGSHGFDSLIFGFYRDKDLVNVASVRNGFVPALRQQIFAGSVGRMGVVTATYGFARFSIKPLLLCLVWHTRDGLIHTSVTIRHT
jgi:hypothetical protein